MERTVRNAVIAGGVVWLVLGGLLVVVVLTRGGGGAATAAALALGLVAGSVVASGWVLMVTVSDLFSRKPFPRARLWWTAGLTALALASPALVAAVAVSATD